MRRLLEWMINSPFPVMSDVMRTSKVTEPYRIPSAVILANDVSREVVRLTIEIIDETYLSYPVAPADLRHQEPHELIFPLHQLTGRNGAQLIFETYDEVELPVPAIGEQFEFCSWWHARGMDAVRDVAAVWKRETYPDNNNHDHCLLTWDTIAAYSNHKEDYHSSRGWITVEAYTKYTACDCLRIRTRPRTVEWSA